MFSPIKIIIKEENFKWHLEAFASELLIYFLRLTFYLMAKYIKIELIVLNCKIFLQYHF